MVHLDSTVNSGRVEISVDNNDFYRVSFRLDTVQLGEVKIARKEQKGGGLRVDTLVVPSTATSRGYNIISLRADSGDGRHSVGHLRLLP